MGETAAVGWIAELERTVAVCHQFCGGDRLRTAALVAHIASLPGAFEEPDEEEPETGFVVDGGWYEERREFGDTLQEAIDKYRAKHGHLPDGWEHINGDDSGAFVGGCEGCGRPIKEGEKYGFDPDGGCYECSDCADPEPNATTLPTSGPSEPTPGPFVSQEKET